MLEKIPRDVALWCWPCLVTKLSHMGVDVDGLPYPLHHPMACSRQTRGQGFLPGVVLSSGLDICEGADRLGAWVIKFHTEHAAFTRICLP
jgi:hypothetical protein